MNANIHKISGDMAVASHDNWSAGQSFASAFFILGLCIYVFSYVTADPDLWGHIKFGEAHWRAGKLAENNLYSFTAAGHPWINHEWLSELVFYFVYKKTGDTGLLVGKLIAGISVVAVMSMTCRAGFRNWLIYLVVISLAISVLSPGFMIRPQLFSFFLFSLCYLLLFLFFEKNRNMLFLYPFIIALWVNLHGGFLMGLALYFCVASWETLQIIILKKENRTLYWLWGCFGASCLVTLVNPYGYNLLIFLYKSLSASRGISEWQPVSIFDASFLPFKVMAGLFLFVLATRKERLLRWDVCFLILLLVVSFRQQRHTPFFGIAAAPFLINGFADAVSFASKRFQQLKLSGMTVNLLVVFICIFSLCFMIAGGLRYHRAHFKIIVDPNRYPVAAAQFMQANRIGGNLLLPFDWGEYAIWKLFPQSRVSIDGRFRTAYPEPVIQDHLAAEGSSSGWARLISRYPADILLGRQTPFFHKLIEKSKQWVYVYSDAVSILFIKRSDRNRLLLERFRNGGFTYPSSAPSIYFP